MRVLTENEVRDLARRMEAGGRFVVPPDGLLTPLARDYLRERGLEIVDRAGTHPASVEGAQGHAHSKTNSPSEAALVEAVAEEVARTLGRPAGAEAAGDSSRDLLSQVRTATGTGGGGGVGREHRAVVWGIGADRPGILAAVAELLGEKQVNILEISQTILSGVFAMVMIVDLTRCSCPFLELKSALEAQGGRLGISLSAQRDEIFQFMHRV